MNIQARMKQIRAMIDAVPHCEYVKVNVTVSAADSVHVRVAGSVMRYEHYARTLWGGVSQTKHIAPERYAIVEWVDIAEPNFSRDLERVQDKLYYCVACPCSEED